MVDAIIRRSELHAMRMAWGHLDVLVRNVPERELSEHFKEAWLALAMILNAKDLSEIRPVIDLSIEGRPLLFDRVRAILYGTPGEEKNDGEGEKQS